MGEKIISYGNASGRTKAQLTFVLLSIFSDVQMNINDNDLKYLFLEDSRTVYLLLEKPLPDHPRTEYIYDKITESLTDSGWIYLGTIIGGEVIHV